ncbi:hypothetical protein NWE60_05405 [Mycoplasmopsis felis]|nr:NAD(P)-dependent oxidoreductase [Mycoplasmopsis felis]WAM01715.1 hypothetical protein NWE60_05405 [Mycoplasmopsis felis]
MVYDSFAQENFPDLANQLGIEFVSLTELLNKSDFISIHCPLFASTKYLINEANIYSDETRCNYYKYSKRWNIRY